MSNLNLYKGSSGLTAEQEDQLNKSFAGYYGGDVNIASQGNENEPVCQVHPGSGNGFPVHQSPDPKTGWIKVAAGFALGLVFMKIVRNEQK